MVTIPVQCPHCHSTEVIKAGKPPTGPNAIGVTTTGARGGAFSCRTRIEAEDLKSAARSSTWRRISGTRPRSWYWRRKIRRAHRSL